MFKAKNIDNLYEYTGELGVSMLDNEWTFSLWAPVSDDVKLLLFDKYNSDKPSFVIDMLKKDKGLWQCSVKKNLCGYFYNYLVTNEGIKEEVVDPYAKSVCVNGTRGMLIDLESTNPEGWNLDTKPILKNPCDSIIYELHVRDFSIDENSGVSSNYKGKYLGLCEEETVNPKSKSKTCLNHLKELGINTVHLMPVFDYITVDETRFDENIYNWGYDPENYNVPEGSYSTDPFTGAKRIEEFKKMVLKLHKNGIRVVLDVVYNHTFKTEDSNFNKIVPNYYYRQDEYEKFSNGSGCGNELATERTMVRKYIVDSIIYWAKEYHVDGFRFDLMGLYDIETITKIRKELEKIDSTIIMYGEGWTGGNSPLLERRAALKINTLKYGSLQIAAFNDNIRDGIKGHVFNAKERGFVNGQAGFEETIKFGIVAATFHRQIDYSKVDSSKEPWANQPYQSITYESAHDNYTLWDKLKVSTGADKEELIKMNKLSAAIVLTSQGIPFLHAGEEFARTKVNKDGTLNENSYNAPDYVNKISWDRKDEYNDIFRYYKGLIAIRNNHVAFRMNTNTKIQDNLKFIKFTDCNIVGFRINGAAVLDEWKDIVVIFNARDEEIDIDLKEDNFNVVADYNKAGINTLYKTVSDIVKVAPKSALIMYK